jgi:hypothetical protein
VLARTPDGAWFPVAPVDGFPVRFLSISGGDGRLLAHAADGGLWVGTATG